MKSFSEYIGSQFGNPNGIIGNICCKIMNIINKPLYDGVIDNTNIDSNRSILDIGYGNGYLIKNLYKKSPCKIYGIDISEDMRMSAEKRNRNALSANKLKLSIGDCCSMKFKDNSFDSITSVNTIYFWQDTLKGLSEIHRTLKPDSTFCNAVYSKSWLKKLSYTKKGFKLFEKENYIRLGKQAGFSNISFSDIKKDKSYLVIFKK